MKFQGVNMELFQLHFLPVMSEEMENFIVEVSSGKECYGLVSIQ